MSTWFITGCSSGLGHALATAVLEAGHNAVVTARRAESVVAFEKAHPDTALAVGLDLTAPEQVAAAVTAAQDRFGTVDVLVNNAGHGYRSAIEEATAEDVDELFATNLFGPLALVRAVLPGMRSAGAGVVVMVSSIAGIRASPGSGYYAASKGALELASEALAKEGAPLGIKVVVVQPGAFRTDFAGRSLRQSPAAIDAYADTAGRRRIENDTAHGTQPGSPEKAAQVLLEVVASPDPPLRLLLGPDAVAVARDQLAARTAEVDRWEALSRSTDY